jgi:1,4-alpha-glucan branching enzyme
MSTQTAWLSDYDLYLPGEGKHLRAYEKMGTHTGEISCRRGVHFAVWARNTRQVSERLAAVGDRHWQQWLTELCEPFTKATIRYFDLADAAAARKWLGDPTG